MITLTIIGVIAALTIPTLMKNYEKRQIEVGLAKTYQELSNVMKRSEIDNGEMLDWNGSELMAPNKTFAQKYIAPYIKHTDCNNHCFKGSGQHDLWKTQPNHVEENQGSYYNHPAKYKLEDGRIMVIVSSYDSGRDWRYVEFFVDVNGNRGNAILGEDVFMFSYIDYYYWNTHFRGLFAGKADNGGMSGYWKTKDRMISNCQTSGYMCSALLMINNWKFPDDYPIIF